MGRAQIPPFSMADPPQKCPDPNYQGWPDPAGHQRCIQTVLDGPSRTFCCPWATASLQVDEPTEGPDQCPQFAAATGLRSYLDRGAGGDDARVVHGVAVIDVIWQGRALLRFWWQGDGGRGVLGGEVHVGAVAEGLDGVSWGGGGQEMFKGGCTPVVMGQGEEGDREAPYGDRGFP